MTDNQPVQANDLTMTEKLDHSDNAHHATDATFVHGDPFTQHECRNDCATDTVDRRIKNISRKESLAMCNLLRSVSVPCIKNHETHAVSSSAPISHHASLNSRSSFISKLVSSVKSDLDDADQPTIPFATITDCSETTSDAFVSLCDTDSFDIVRSRLCGGSTRGTGVSGFRSLLFDDDDDDDDWMTTANASKEQHSQDNIGLTPQHGVLVRPLHHHIASAASPSVRASQSQTQMTLLEHPVTTAPRPSADATNNTTTNATVPAKTDPPKTPVQLHIQAPAYVSPHSRIFKSIRSITTGIVSPVSHHRNGIHSSRKRAYEFSGDPITEFDHDDRGDCGLGDRYNGHGGFGGLVSPLKSPRWKPTLKFRRGDRAHT